MSEHITESSVQYCVIVYPSGEWQNCAAGEIFCTLGRLLYLEAIKIEAKCAHKTSETDIFVHICPICMNVIFYIRFQKYNYVKKYM